MLSVDGGLGGMQRVIISIALVRWSWSCARYGGEASEEPGPSTGRSPKARNGTGPRHGPRVSARCRGACEGAERRLREGEERLGEGSGRGRWTLGKTSEPSVRRTARTRETACGQRGADGDWARGWTARWEGARGRASRERAMEPLRRRDVCIYREAPSFLHPCRAPSPSGHRGWPCRPDLPLYPQCRYSSSPQAPFLP